MFSWIARFLVTPLALLLAAAFIPGVAVESLYTAVVVAVLLAIINITLRPLLLLLTFPITILTLGLFIFIINTLMLLLVASFVDGFGFSGFLPALFTALVIAAASWIADALLE